MWDGNTVVPPSPLWEPQKFHPDKKALHLLNDADKLSLQDVNVKKRFYMHTNTRFYGCPISRDYMLSVIVYQVFFSAGPGVGKPLKIGENHGKP